MDYLIDEMREARMNGFHRAVPSQRVRSDCVDVMNQ